VRRLRSQGSAGGALPLRGRRRPVDARSNASRTGRLHVSTARMLRAGARAARIQPRAAAHRDRGAGAGSPLH
jgi:hypothetical protein